MLNFFGETEPNADEDESNFGINSAPIDTSRPGLFDPTRLKIRVDTNNFNDS